MKHPQQFLRDIEHANGGYDDAEFAKYADQARRDRNMIRLAAVLIVALMGCWVWGAMV